MRDELLRALQPREETLTLAGVAVVVREIRESDDEGGITWVMRPDALYHYMVRSVFDAESGEPCFTEADIPALKGSGKVRLRVLAAAVMRVNGLDAEYEIKNSAAGPASGSSSVSPSRPAASTWPNLRGFFARWRRPRGAPGVP